MSADALVFIVFIVFLLINVSSAKLLIVNQCVSNSPSKIRGGWGALILQE